MKPNIFIISKKNKMFYLYFYLFMLVVHLSLPLNWGDDAVFFEKSSRLNLFEFLDNSARPIIDAFTYFFIRFPMLWRFINPFILTTEAIIISKYLPGKNCNEKNAFFSIALLFPSMFVVDAGFIATTLNYLWAVTFGLLSLLSIWKKINNLNLNFFVKIILLPCLLYALNMQQMAILLFFIFGGACLYFIWNKNFSLYIFLQFIVTVCGLTISYLLNIVGDDSRMIRESTRYFPTFEKLSFFNKIELGFSSTLYSLTIEPSFAWIVFFSFLLVLIYFTFKNNISFINKLITSFPLLFSIFGIFDWFGLWGSRRRFFGKLYNYKMEKAVYTFDIIVDFFFLIVLVCVLYTLFLLIKDKRKLGLSLMALSLGLGTRMVMGFSPTVWASGYRTFYILFVSLIVVTYLIINDNVECLHD